MIKENGKKLLLLIIALLLMPMIVFAEDVEEDEYIGHYDELFKNSEFVINTDAPLVKEDYQGYFEGFVSNITSRYNYNYTETIAGIHYNYYLDVSDCKEDTLTCNFKVTKEEYKSNDWENRTTTTLKEYKNIKVVAHNEDFSSYFTEYLKGDTLIINYDEEMFENDYEKLNYVSSFVSRDNTYSNTGVYKNYEADAYGKIITFVERRDGWTVAVIRKTFNDIKYEYTETPYSDEFKRLTSDGKVKLNSNKPASSVAYDYLNYIGGNFSLTGVFKDNKSYVYRYVYENNEKKIVEQHLVTFEVGDVDKDAYKGFITDDTLVIKSGLKLGNNDYSNYVRSYASMVATSVNNEDGSTDSFTTCGLSWSDDDHSNDYICIRNTRTDKEGKVIANQFYYVGIKFTGYDKDAVMSDEFKKDIGETFTVRSNDKTLSSVNEALNNVQKSGNYYYDALGCNSDYTVCDVRRYSYSDSKVNEMHPVKMVFDDSVSERFKKAFNLGNDDKIDVTVGKDVNLYSVSLYIYNDDTNDQYSYYCYYGKCTLTLKNYYDNTSETHKLDLNFKRTTPSKYFSDNVDTEKVLYPGSNKYYQWNISGKNKFSKKDGFYTYANNCDTDKKTCVVYVITENYGIEAHTVKYSVNEGKSPELEAILPGDTIEVPIAKPELIKEVYGDEEYEYYPYYVYSIMDTYLSNLTKSNINIYNIIDDVVTIEYNGFEQQEYTVKFAERDSKIDAEVKSVEKKINAKEFDFVVEDLELVNNFYYADAETINNNRVNVGASNIVKKVTDYVDNKNIVVSYMGEGGFGCGMGGYGSSGDEDYEDCDMPFSEKYSQAHAAELALYYSGVAYGYSSAFYRVNDVIYIPENTEDNVEAYVKAAQKKIDEYLGKDNGVVVKFSEALSDEYVKSSKMDLAKSDKNVYKLIHKDKIVEVLIMKDSKKMEKPTLEAQDVVNKVSVKVENSVYPTDTIVNTKVMEETTKEFKEVLKKIKADAAQVIDISLYSPTAGDITDFTRGAIFKVTVPVTNPKLKGKELIAYYMNEKGDIVSEHDVTVDENDNATFETTHFSTYILAEKPKKSGILPPLPNTVDAILYFVGIAGLSIAGMVVSKKYMVKKD